MILFDNRIWYSLCFPSSHHSSLVSLKEYYSLLLGHLGSDRTVPYSLAQGFGCFFTPINVLCHSLSKFPRKFACYLNVSSEDCVVPRKQISYLFGNKSSWQNELKFKRLKQLAQSERNNARQYCKIHFWLLKLKNIDFQLNKSKFCSNTIFSICRIILKLEKKHHKLLHLYQWMFNNEIEREW